MIPIRSGQLLAEGEWRPGGAGTALAVSPSSGEVIATVAVGDTNDIDQAVHGAMRAFAPWSTTSPFERASVCEAVVTGLRSRRDELARVLSLDQGKPLLAEAYDEVDEAIEYFHMAGEDARRGAGSIPFSVSAARRVLVQRVPLGVVGVVSPWNWPFTMAAELVAPALAAGNAVVWVPSPSTTACSTVLADVIFTALERSGAPRGVFGFVPGPGPVVGDALVGHPLVNAVGFVGSVETGLHVSARAAGKAQILELGGNGPFVVLEDADLDLAAREALVSAYFNAGQSCTAGERFLVHRSVCQEFVERVVELTKNQVRLGESADPATTLGPLNNEPTAAKFDRHIADAVARGGRLRCGGRRSSDFSTNLFAEPTVIDGVTADMEIAAEETFGPVVPVLAVASAAEALAMANAAPHGLTTAVFSKDLERAMAFAEGARFGWVNINATTNLWESHLPFGGSARSVSGRGRIGGALALDAFSEPKTILYPAPRRLDRA